MSDYYAMSQIIIAENGSHDYRWVVTDYCLGAGCDGITIEYQEKADGDFVTKDSIDMGEEPAQLLIQALNKIKL